MSADVGILIRDALQPLRGGGDRPAIRLEDEPAWTYRELHEYANRVSNALLARGVKRGDRVGLLLFNGPEYVGWYFGVARIGAIAVRLNWRLAPEELEYAVTDAGCSVLAVHDELRPELAVPHVIDVDGGWGDDRSEPAVPQPSPDDPAMIMYTSGTTGRPKGAVWTHGNTVAFAAMQQKLWGLGPETVGMTTGPLFHVGSFEDVVTATFLAQGQAVLTRSRGFDIERILEVMQRVGTTEVLLQSSMLYDLLRSPNLPGADLGSLRRLFTGGTNLHEWALRSAAEQLPDVEVHTLYGLTEGGAISTSLRLEAGSGSTGVGVPLPMTEVRVEVDGEVLVRSASSSVRYWGKPAETAETFVDGWCHTGDLGRIEDGSLHITGRKKDMIKSGGENVYAIEVENVLLRHPTIADVAVIAVPDSTYHEGVCAVVVAAEGSTVDRDEVIGFCRKHLAGYKKPRHVVVVDELPRTQTGKVRKHELREQYAGLEQQTAAAAAGVDPSGAGA